MANRFHSSATAVPTTHDCLAAWWLSVSGLGNKVPGWRSWRGPSIVLFLPPTTEHLSQVVDAGPSEWHFFLPSAAGDACWRPGQGDTPVYVCPFHVSCQSLPLLEVTVSCPSAGGGVDMSQSGACSQAEGPLWQLERASSFLHLLVTSVPSAYCFLPSELPSPVHRLCASAPWRPPVTAGPCRLRAM